ncbi:hypothetical protein PHYSODRAFT_517489 [Phytophthora sojae]|uniref:Uncharacterized protein n=1 Tax=Phytophthora sojae (strain P6497) TaxID=1094619 RepID=G4ZXI7_PHYSP|nr:hypothetical protein PHYSODRAFT_517489 [Phytophthora sojae]EGZ11850.1 hypothetical protein PHYSODRAFT_517489 [Phytophthora sojae]|eukprot:XP_009532183.1 hypothetical protein PHYSODRAFT_517489 [Phytophthora sojae]
MASTATQRDHTKYLLDRNKQSVYSEFIRRSGMQLPEFVRPLRGETEHDPRPNKSLIEPTSLSAWQSYRYKTQWAEIVQHGVCPRWKSGFAVQDAPPANHGSAVRALNIIVKCLRKGQDENRYLILDLELLSILHGVTCSPFGAVQKGDADLTVDARLIHDLSFPPGASVNGNTVPDHEIDVCYDGPDALANRILDVDEVFPKLQQMMTGDVNGAFRNIPVSADNIDRFAGTIPELGILVIDLCCPFGWSNSPVSYWVAGAAISHLYSCSAPEWPLQPTSGKNNFDAKTWWRALGLDWNLHSNTVSMPPEKISKALYRVHDMATRAKTTRTQLQKLLGSLRHVLTCVRAATPFFQRVAALARAAPRFGTVEVSFEAKGDLQWFEMVIRIGKLNVVPLSRFTRRQEPNYHIQMDASDKGLCALFPLRKQYLQVQFTDAEIDLIRQCNEEGDSTFCINVRELMSAVFASLVWGCTWKDLTDNEEAHVKFWIENTSAVAWSNHKTSRNLFAQMLLRILGICEVQHGFYTMAAHVAGVDNQMADAGSRIWQSPVLAAEFANLSSDWTQVQIPAALRDLSRLWERYCEQVP